MRIVLAQPRGFCAGVERAIGIVEHALERFGPPVYVRHEIVHNKHVVEALKSKGARFVDEVDQIPRGAVAVFSAHGVAESVDLAARERGLRVIDAACPLVTKVHKEGQRYAGNGFDVVLIGHAGHPEVEGTMGRIKGRVHLIGSVEDVARLEPSDPSRLAFVTQTTLSVDDTRDIIVALRARFPAIVGPDTRDICYATQNRQTAVRALARQVDLILVVGAQNSSNSNRLRELGEAAGTPSYLIESAENLDRRWLDGVRTLGITAGASAPELLVQDLIANLRKHYAVQVEVLAGIEENVHFRLPPELADLGVPMAADRPALQ
ncbi:MAG TPA: 4-hydroxy-3-methylbut-2-enyl diphosphate reductase [Geminicoccaceae bacterium]|nr:4-hydroxy-3-methylbut-2-enyl diphosphate reductase [Geminicoccaceae bacterium]